MQRGKQFLKSIFGRDEEATLSRRDALAGLGLGALFVATARFAAPGAAEATPLEKPAEAAAGSPAPETQAAETAQAEGASDATDLSSQRWRRRRYWRRRWRRRYWRRPYWRRRRHWRRRYWRRRYRY